MKMLNIYTFKWTSTINIIFLFEKHIIVHCRFGAKIKSRNHTICMVLTVHSRYFEDINSMSCDTVTPKLMLSAFLKHSSQNKQMVEFSCSSSPISSQSSSLSLPLSTNEMGNRVVDKTWVTPDRLKPCKPSLTFCYLVKYRSWSNLVQSRFYWCLGNSPTIQVDDILYDPRSAELSPINHRLSNCDRISCDMHV